MDWTYESLPNFVVETRRTSGRETSYLLVDSTGRTLLRHIRENGAKTATSVRTEPDGSTTIVHNQWLAEFEILPSGHAVLHLPKTLEIWLGATLLRSYQGSGWMNHRVLEDGRMLIRDKKEKKALLSFTADGVKDEEVGGVDIVEDARSLGEYKEFHQERTTGAPSSNVLLYPSFAKRLILWDYETQKAKELPYPKIDDIIYRIFRVNSRFSLLYTSEFDIYSLNRMTGELTPGIGKKEFRFRGVVAGRYSVLLIEDEEEEDDLLLILDQDASLVTRLVLNGVERFSLYRDELILYEGNRVRIANAFGQTIRTFDVHPVSKDVEIVSVEAVAKGKTATEVKCFSRSLLKGKLIRVLQDMVSKYV